MTPSVVVLALDGFDQLDTLLTGSAEARVVGTSYRVSAQIDKGKIDFPTIAPTVVGTAFRLRVNLFGATDGVSEPFDVTH